MRGLASVTFVILLALAGCADGAAAEEPSPTASEPPILPTPQVAESSPEPTMVSDAGSPEPTYTAESVDADTGPVLTHEWVDEDGYGYRITITGAALDGTVDIASAKPGNAMVTWGVELYATLENTSSGHDAPIPFVAFEPLYAIDSALCQSSAAGSFSLAFDGDAWCTVAGAPWKSDLPSFNSVENVIPVGGSFDIEMVYPIGGNFEEVEAESEAVLDSIRTPDMWAIGLGGQIPQEQLYTGCLMSNGFYLAAASGDTGCER